MRRNQPAPARNNSILQWVGALVVTDSYHALLDRADAFFAEVRAAQPANLECRTGCTGCCHGLFEISLADVTVLIDGLRTLEPSLRDDLVTSSKRVMHETSHPVLREVDSTTKTDFFDRVGEVPCPALGEKGECRIYAFRPLACRTFGLPLREGPVYRGEECELNFTRAPQSDKERAAWDLEWEDVLGPEDELTIPEAIVLANRLDRDFVVLDQPPLRGPV